MSLSVGLLSDSYSLQEWEAQAIQQLQSSDDFDVNIDTIIVNVEEDEKSMIDNAKKLLTEPDLFKFLVAIGVARDVILGDPWYRRPVPLKSIIDIESTSVIECSPMPAADFGNLLPDVGVAALEQVDVAIRFGFGILKGKALTAPEYGVLSYHHGDLHEYRGRPAGFYEFVNGEAEVGVTIQQLTGQLDSGKIAASTKCRVENASSWRDVKERQFSASPALLPDAVQACTENQLTEPDELGEVYTTPNNKDVLKYIRTRLIPSVK